MTEVLEVEFSPAALTEEALRELAGIAYLLDRLGLESVTVRRVTSEDNAQPLSNAS